MISIICAMDEKRGIGKDNELLFKIPADFKRMKALTTGHPIVMGRKTFESIGRVLPNRTNIVITRDRNFQFEGVEAWHNLENAIEVANTKPGGEEIFIFGGGQIFKEALEKEYVNRLYLTVVQGDYGADVFFPEYAKFKKIMNREEHIEDGYSFTFLDLEK